MRTLTLATGLLLATGPLLAGCGASAQKPAISSALENDQMRRESFEATLRVLDEHPAYVDEFVSAALRHPRTLDRFMQDTARELRRDEFARFVARRLTADAQGLKQTFIASLDEASDDPRALRAMSEAIAARPQPTAMVVVQSETTIRRELRALLEEVAKNPEARRAFLTAVSENSDLMARIVAPDGKVVAELMKAFARVGVSKAEKELNAVAKALE